MWKDWKNGQTNLKCRETFPVTQGQIVTRISIIDIAKDNPKDNVDKVG